MTKRQPQGLIDKTVEELELEPQPSEHKIIQDVKPQVRCLEASPGAGAKSDAPTPSSVAAPPRKGGTVLW